MCRSRTAQNPPSQSDKGKNFCKRETHWVVTTEDYEHFPDNAILTVGNHGKNRPITVQLELHGWQVLMQVDTGAAVSIIAEATQQKLFPNAHLEQASVQFQTYTAESLALLGTMKVQVKHGNYVGKQMSFVISRNGPTLLGCDWLMTIRLNWQSLVVVTVQNTLLTLKLVLDKYFDVFKKELGTLKGFKVKFTLKPDSKLQFCRPRQVPYALKDAVDRELQHLEDTGVIERVPHSKWATPLVAVPKGDGSVRFRGDYCKTVDRKM